MYDGCRSASALRRASWRNVMSKIASAIVTATLAVGTLLSPAPAGAENGQIAAGVVGGLIGGGVCGSGPAPPPRPPPPGHYAPAPACDGEPACPRPCECY